MSARRPRLALSSNAQRDLQNILVDTEQAWGRPQRRAYIQRINQAFANLRSHPHIGLAQSDFGEGTRSFRVGQHVTLYQPSETDTLILRILHARRDRSDEFD